jgi:hypothetical protein
VLSATFSDMSDKKKHANDDSARELGAQPTWLITYYLTQEKTAPAVEFLQGCPTGIRAQFVNALYAVAAAPPPRFTGGGMWEAMHGTMGGWYEIRLTGAQPSRSATISASGNLATSISVTIRAG